MKFTEEKVCTKKFNEKEEMDTIHKRIPKDVTDMKCSVCYLNFQGNLIHAHLILLTLFIEGKYTSECC